MLTDILIRIALNRELFTGAFLACQTLVFLLFSMMLLLVAPDADLHMHMHLATSIPIRRLIA